MIEWTSLGAFEDWRELFTRFYAKSAITGRYAKSTCVPLVTRNNVVILEMCRHIGLLLASTVFVVACLVAVFTSLAHAILPAPYNLVSTALAAGVTGLVGAGVAWLLDGLRLDETHSSQS